MRHFATVAGLENRYTNSRMHEKIPQYFAHNLGPDASWDKDFFSWDKNQVLTFSFVRHPFER